MSRQRCRWSPYQLEIAKNAKKKTVAPRSRKPSAKTRGNPEFHEQAALVKWARLNGLLLISIPNAGKRSLWMAQKEKAMGLTVGASDLFLCRPSNQYHGFFIEMKSKGKKPTQSQCDFFSQVRALGYCAEYFDDWEKARESIENYLKS